MLSKKTVDVRLEPFPHFTIDDYLPADLYEQLRRDWPDRRMLSKQLGEGKFIRPVDPETLAALSETFRWVYSVFNSQAFVEDYFAVLKEGFRRACAPLPIRGFRLSSAGGAGLFDRTIEMSSEFSLLEADAFLSAHTDKFTKFLSLLVYFPPDDWKEEYGGQTVLYEAVKPHHSRNWSNRHLPFDQVREVTRSRYKPNAAFGFIKAPNSWHGVLPITAPSGVARHSLNVNYQTPAGVQKQLPHRLLEAFHRRVEAPRFRDAPDMKEENRRMREARIRDLAAQGLAPDALADRFMMTREAVEQVLETRVE